MENSNMRKKEELYKDKSWLEREYLGQKKSCEWIGNECGVWPMTIYRWLLKHNIPVRPRLEAVKNRWKY